MGPSNPCEGSPPSAHPDSAIHRSPVPLNKKGAVSGESAKFGYASPVLTSITCHVVVCVCVYCHSMVPQRTLPLTAGTELSGKVLSNWMAAVMALDVSNGHIGPDQWQQEPPVDGRGLSQKYLASGCMQRNDRITSSVRWVHQTENKAPVLWRRGKRV